MNIVCRMLWLRKTTGEVYGLLGIQVIFLTYENPVLPHGNSISTNTFFLFALYNLWREKFDFFDDRICTIEKTKNFYSEKVV